MNRTGPGAPIYGVRAPAPGTVAPQPDGTGGLLRPKAHWVPAEWADLPGWDKDQVRNWWPALWKGCAKPAPAWVSVCADVKRLGADWGQQVDDGFVRQWVQSQLRPWRVAAMDGGSNGLMTGYFEPMLEGRRQPDARFQYPLHKAPVDLGQRKPYFNRTELETSPEGRAAVMGRELVYLADPLDVLLIQVQGSGRIRLQDETNEQGQPRVMRLAFAGHNDQPYQSVARWLSALSMIPFGSRGACGVSSGGGMPGGKFSGTGNGNAGGSGFCKSNQARASGVRSKEGLARWAGSVKCSAKPPMAGVLRPSSTWRSTRVTSRGSSVLTARGRPRPSTS